MKEIEEMIEKKKTEFEMLLENLEYVVFEDKVFLSASSKRSLGLTFSSSIQEVYKKGINDAISICDKRTEEINVFLKTVRYDETYPKIRLDELDFTKQQLKQLTTEAK